MVNYIREEFDELFLTSFVGAIVFGIMTYFIDKEFTFTRFAAVIIASLAISSLSCLFISASSWTTHQSIEILCNRVKNNTLFNILSSTDTALWFIIRLISIFFLIFSPHIISLFVEDAFNGNIGLYSNFANNFLGLLSFPIAISVISVVFIIIGNIASIIQIYEFLAKRRAKHKHNERL